MYYGQTTHLTHRNTYLSLTTNLYHMEVYEALYALWRVHDDREVVRKSGRK